MLIWGAGLQLTQLTPPGLALRIAPGLRRAGDVVVALLVLSALAKLPLLAASFGDGWTDAGNVEILLRLVATAPGAVAVIGAQLAVLFVASWGLGDRPWPAATALAGLTLLACALTGHATEGGLLHQLNDAVHLAASGFWLGALLPLALAMRQPGDDALITVRRFAVVGQIAVALTLITGVVNTWLTLGRLPIDPASSYDRLLGLKLLLVAAMLTLALTNHFRHLPRLRLGGDAAALAIRRGALVEIGLGVAAVALVALFGMMDPG